MSYERVDPYVLAERLSAARKAAKITQEFAADHLGMSRPTFIAMEKGTRRPRPDELVKLSKLYKEPLNRLLRDDKKPTSASLPHLRSALGSVSGGEEEVEAAVAKLLSFVDDYQYLESLSGSKPVVSFPPQVRIPPGPIERFAEYCAQEERERLNLGSHQPVYLLRKVLEEAGLHVFFDQLHSKLAGLYVFVPDFGYCILVNAVHPKERRRWTIAHEYGHFLADRDRPGVDFIKAMQRKSESERFADTFASALLMPEVGVRRRFYEEVDRTGDFKVGDLCRMADFYDVSLMAMALRLESLNLIPDGSWDEIQASRVPVNALQREAGVEEEQDMDSLAPYPERYRLLAVQAFKEEKVSEGQLARLLRTSRIHARDIVARCSEADSDADGLRSRVPLELTHSLLTSSGR
jgi:Zn-dependent peptidase ImmA (M78 family)/transcriptional regulator with XRE-family HTH domain